MNRPVRDRSATIRRSVARKLAMQALYRWQVNTGPWQDLVQEFADAEDMPKADNEYFVAIISGVVQEHETLDAELAVYLDRKPAELDPLEHAVLLLAMHEFKQSLDVPYRVVINEAVGLTKRFGATDGHKYVNAVLDRAARTLRVAEQ